jgi:hypothetical protein
VEVDVKTDDADDTTFDDAEYARACVTIAWTALTTALCSQVTDEEAILLNEARERVRKTLAMIEPRRRHEGVSCEDGTP